MSHPLPETVAARLAQIGRALYGNRWQLHVARGMGVSRSSIVLWSQGHRSEMDVDGMLLDLLRRRGLTVDQVGPVVALEKKLAAYIEEKA